ncbi:MAG: PQQ-dependent sugar dehydrogenase [Armatimonadota bacterium]|jgi:glucose/arabinose dehydrogenase
MRTYVLLVAATLLALSGCSDARDGAAVADGEAGATIAQVDAGGEDAPGAGQAPTPPLDQIELPEGFRIHYYASDVPGARSMALSPGGILYVGTRRDGNVYAVIDADGDHRAERVVLIDSGMNMPNGVAWRDGSLYVAEINRILRYDEIDERIDDPPDPVVVYDGYPTDRHHGWKFIAFGPDGKLYVPVGAPCNVCESAEIYASITRINPDGTGREIIAHGVRNTVGFDWHPETGELWFTDNGRDSMGDNIPPDELNRLREIGQHFGFPYCHGRDVLDPVFGEGRSCDEFTLPEVELGPHVAALGMRFYTGEMFPEEYRGDIFIAEHGSWDRTEKIGYRVTRIRMDGSEPLSYEPFAEGWLQGQSDWGRPVDVLVMPDGSMLVSDDKAGAIYRIVHE